MTKLETRRLMYSCAAAAAGALAALAPLAGASAAHHSGHAASTPTWLSVNSKAHSATLTIIAGYNGNVSGFNFNGYGNGKMVVTIPKGYKVTVVFSNKGSFPHSVVFTPFSDLKKMDGYPLAFKGSTSPDNTSGIQAGSKAQKFTFTVDKTGKYAIVCGVTGHEAAGMWDVLMVSNGGSASIKTSK